MKRVLAVLLLLALLCACQPTPEQDVVVNRGEEDADALIHTSPAPEAVSIRDAVAALAPAAEAETGMIAGRLKLDDVPDIGDVAVDFDAVVTVPDIAEWPIYAVRRGAWSTDERIAILKAAAGGAPVYAYGQYGYITKAYYEQVLRKMETSIRVQETDRILAQDPDEDMTFTQRVQEYFRYAPETVTLQPFDETNVLDASDESVSAFFPWDEQNTYVDFFAAPDQISLKVFDRKIENEDFVRQGEWLGATPGRELTNPSLTVSEAVNKAKTFLSAIGFTDAALSEAESKKAQRSHAFTLEVESEGCLLVFRRGINGIPGIAPDHPEVNPSETSYAKAWPQERAEVYVDSDGVWMLTWQNPVKITETLTESAALMDLDSVIRIVKARIRAENMNAEDRMIASVHVKKLRLGYCIVSQKDDPDTGYTLPVWITDYEVQMTDGRVVPYSFTVSALNGAYLHLDLNGISAGS